MSGRVVETRPMDSKVVMLGDRAYKVRAEAERELATVCAATPAVGTKECFFEGQAFSEGATNRLGQVCEGKAWR